MADERCEAGAICTDADCWPHANSNVIESRKMGLERSLTSFYFLFAVNTNENYIFLLSNEFFHIDKWRL